MKSKIAIIGLGYVGLPLAIEFSKKYQVVAYDFYNAILIAVPNKKFKRKGIKSIAKYAKKKRVIFDLKNSFNNHQLIDCTL